MWVIVNLVDIGGSFYMTKVRYIGCFIDNISQKLSILKLAKDGRRRMKKQKISCFVF